jgi:hypothetical protein
VKERFPGSADA